MAEYGGFLEEVERVEGGNSVIWSHEIEDHGRMGIGSGLSKPWGGR